MDTAFIELQSKWYALLVLHGFEDIEDVTQRDRPLLSWSGVCHNHLVESERTILNQWPESPFAMQEELLYHPQLPMVCENICKHGNHSLGAHQVRKILEMHIRGMTCREIGRILDISYVTVFRAQKKLTEWAIVIESRD